MARSSRRREEEVEEELPPIPSTAQETSELDAERDIDDILAEVGSSVSVKIARVNPETGNSAYVGTMRGEDFSLDALADAYGGGTYILRVISGRETISKSRVEIDSAIPPKNPRSPRAMNNPQQSNGNDLLQTIIIGQADASRRSMELMTTMMTGLAGAMTSMMSVMREARPLEAQQNPLELLKTAAEIVRPTSPARSAVSELRDIIEIADSIRGGGSGDNDGTMPVIGKAIDAVTKMVEHSQQNPQPRVPPRPPTALPPSAAPVQPTPTAVVPVMPAPTTLWGKAMQPHVVMLRMMIGSIQPGTAADLISQKLGKPEFAALVSDALEGFNDGDDVTAQGMQPFATRVAAQFALPTDDASIQWLSEVALECVGIFQESLTEDDKEDADESGDEIGVE